jgi:hypothetical protein
VGVAGAAAAAVAEQGQPQLQLPQSQALQTEVAKPQQVKTVVAINFDIGNSPSRKRQSEKTPCNSLPAAIWRQSLNQQVAIAQSMANKGRRIYRAGACPKERGHRTTAEQRGLDRQMEIDDNDVKRRWRRKMTPRSH